ncbi:MAG: hypothetical protein ACI9O6_001106 [Glaciecola sp.]|jgi:hypothetical protein
MRLRNRTKLFACMAVMGMAFAAPSFAGTVCSTSVMTQEGSIDANDSLMYAMESFILSKDFDPSLPYKVTSEKSQCSKLNKAQQSKSADKNTLNGIPLPDPNPSEGDTRTVTRTRPDGTRSWAYTYTDGAWVLTGWSFTPKAHEESDIEQ